MAAKFAGIAGTGFLVLLFMLHVIKPELEPSWHFISEYALGSYGWMMSFAFLLLAAGYVSIFIVIRTQIAGKVWGRIGLILALISATGLTLAGIFTTDPLLTPQENMTTSGMLHNIGGTLGIAMPFATLLITWGLIKNPGWISSKRALLWSAGFALMGFLVSFVSLGVMLSQSNGSFGPGVLVGWPNRLEIVGYTVWLITVARQAIKIRKTTDRAN